MTIISLENSTGQSTQFLDSIKDDMEPEVTPTPTMTHPTSNMEELDEPMEHIFNALKRIAIPSPTDDTDAENNESPFDLPEASSSMASRVMATEDAVVELIRVTVIHTNMLKDLQTANAALSEQLEANKMKLDQLEVIFRALRHAQTPKLMPKHMFDTDKATSDDQLFAISPSARYSRFLNAYPPHSNTFNILAPAYINPQGMDMSGLAATLAVAPRLPSSTSPASSRSSSSNFKERRQFKPHREEHVKRSRVTYDSKGGQTPNISPPSLSCNDGELDKDLQETVQDTSSAQSSRGSVSSDEDSEEDAEEDGPSLTSWLYVKATKALFGQ